MSALDLRLYAVVDPQLTGGHDLETAVAAAVRGGATLVQYRDKGPDARAMVERVMALRRMLPSSIPLIVNDRVDVARAAGADGVHLGQRDLMPAQARTILGDAAIIGLTVHHPHEAAADARVDYAGLGPVYATASKDPRDPPLGPRGLERLAETVRERLGPLPLCAIAGIDAERAPDVIAAGVDGVAVIGALFSAADVEAAARRLRRAVDHALEQRNRT